MDNKSSAPSPSPNRAPKETSLNPQAEIFPYSTQENKETSPDLQPSSAESNASPLEDQTAMTELPPPIPTTSSLSDHVSDTIDDPALEAADGDQLEPEWIKQTEEVLRATKNDPSKKEKRINRLKFSYLWKRFKRRLGDGNN